MMRQQGVSAKDPELSREVPNRSAAPEEDGGTPQEKL